MTFRRAALRRLALVLLCAVSLTSAATAQLPQTRIFALYPQGAQAGQTVDVTISNGVDVDELDAMMFSHPGIKAEHVSGSNFKVTVAANVPPGIYDARVHGLYGTSNPRCFVVGTLPEVNETEANNTVDQAQAIEMGTVINGRSNGAADVDFFKITGKKGQRILAECSAIRIDSRFHGELKLYNAAGRRLGRSIALERRFDPLLDVTLPEDGDYIVRVADFVYAGSNDYGYRLTLHVGPHIDFVVPPAGIPGSTAKYTLYGRNLPGSQPAGIASDGRQLQKLEVQIALPNTSDQLQPGNSLFAREAGIDGSSYVFKGANGTSNPVTIAFAPRAVGLEVEPNNEAAQSQKITIPAEIAGQFQERADIDRFEFEAKKGQIFWVEAFAQRLGSLADPYLLVEQVTKADDGTETIKRLATVDDIATTVISALFETNHDDVAWRFAVPADGLYRIVLQDRFFQSRGAANFTYHLTVREEELDFRLAVIPPAPVQNPGNGYQTWSLGLRKGDNLHIQVGAFRRHGFKGPIDVMAENLPPGVTCKGASIDGNASSATLVFTATEDVKPGSWPLKFVGKAHIESPTLVAAVTAAEAALKMKVDAQPKLQEAFDKTVDPAKKAEDARKAAETVAKTDADAVKKATDAKTAADKKLTEAQAGQKTADDAKTAADKALADAKTAVANAVKAVDAAKKELDQDKQNQGLKDKVAAAEKTKTDADAALTTADTAAKEATTKAAAAKTATDKAKTEADNVTKALATATAKAKQTADALAKAVAARDAAQAASKKAEDAKNAGEKAIVDGKKAIEDARKAKDAAARDVSHPARTATIVWNGSNVLSATSRLSDELMLSVLDEVSPFQVTTDVFRENLSHNRQILIPVKLTKRNGFNNDVQLTFQNVPKNVQVQNQKIAKDPEAEKVLKAATDAATKAAAASTKATTELNTANVALQKAQSERDAEKKKLTDAQSAEQTASNEKTAADKNVVDAQTKVDAAVKLVADAKAAADKDKENQDLVKAVATATKTKTDADAALKVAQDAQKAADVKQKAAQAATKVATDSLAAKEKVFTDAQANVKTKTEASTAADTAKADADAKVKEAKATATAEAIVRVFVPNNVAEGTYTLFMQSQGQVPYSRNPARVERAKVLQQEAVAALAEATEAARRATAAAAKANSELTAATAALNTAQQQRDAEKTKLTAAQAAEQKATQAKAAADKAVTDAQAKVDAAAKAVTDAKAAADKDKENQDLAKAVVAAEKTKTDSDAALKATQDAQKAATETLTTAQAATKAATESVAAREKAATDAQTDLTKKTEAKTAADAAKTQGDAKVKEVTAKKTAADNELKAATTAAAVKNVNVFAPSTPIVINVRKGGFTLAANVPNGGNLKRGQKLEIKVTVARINGFTGAVTINLAPPPGTKGLSSQPVTIAADQKEATLVVSAAGDATEGDIANLVVRGTADWNGPSSADIAAKIKIGK